MRHRYLLLVVLAAAVAGCALERAGLRHDDGGGEGADAFMPPRDFGPRDGFVPPPDLGPVDAFVPPADLGPPDLGPADAFVPPLDLGSPDLGPVDAFVPPPDLGPPDLGPVDAFVLPADLGPPPCGSGATRCASAAALETCTGAVWTPTTCALGCSATGTAHCLVMIPSNVDAALFVDGGNVVVAGSATWNTGSCAVGSLPGLPTRVTQAGGGDVCVVRVHDLNISGQVSVQGPIPLVILAQGEIVISGTLDVSAYGTTEGPGGGLGSNFTRFASGPSAGDDGGNTATYTDSGGGGGGFCGAGGNGGDAGGTLAGGPGGAVVVTNLSPLIGGSGGGTGGAGESTGLGGAGGGAVQLSALVRVQVGGRIYAGGGGGGGGLDGTTRDWNIGAGGGGGSGGSILIESPVVDLSGTLRGSGGGGGGAASCRGYGVAGNGTDGAAVSGAPSGGVRGGLCAGGAFGGVGGAGGADATLGGTNGDSNGASGGNGAGGGGAAGCIVVRTPTGALPAGGVRSPSVAPGLQGLLLHTL